MIMIICTFFSWFNSILTLNLAQHYSCYSRGTDFPMALAIDTVSHSCIEKSVSKFPGSLTCLSLGRTKEDSISISLESLLFPCNSDTTLCNTEVEFYPFWHGLCFIFLDCRITHRILPFALRLSGDIWYLKCQPLRASQQVMAIVIQVLGFFWAQ